jgi:hypothetical protein
MRKIPFKRHLDRLRQWFSPSRREPVTLKEALPWLVPKVRPRFHYEALALRTGRAWPEFRPLAGLFAVSLAVDTPTGELDVGPEDLARWNADFDRLMQKARSNLLARGGEEGFLKLGPGRFRSSWQDNLDGSRMLLPGILRRLPLAGDPVVVLPSRDTLLVVGSEDPAALRWALDGAAALMDADPGSLNGCPLRFRNLQWEPFQPAGEDPLNPLLQRLGSRRLQEEYGSQKALLDRRHGLAGKAITVTPYRVERASGGTARSFTVWSQTMGEAWLPQADQVRLSWEWGREPGRAWVPWERLQARLGEVLEPVGLFPERYRFREQPGPRQLESLLA